MKTIFSYLCCLCFISFSLSSFVIAEDEHGLMTDLQEDILKFPSPDALPLFDTIDQSLSLSGEENSQNYIDSEQIMIDTGTELGSTNSDEIVIDTPIIQSELSSFVQSETLPFQEETIQMPETPTHDIVSDSSMRTVLVDEDQVTIIWK